MFAFGDSQRIFNTFRVRKKGREAKFFVKCAVTVTRYLFVLARHFRRQGKLKEKGVSYLISACEIHI